MVGAVTELELYYPVGADLCDGGTSPGLEELSQARGEGGGGGSGGSCKVGQMGAEARVDD